MNGTNVLTDNVGAYAIVSGSIYQSEEAEGLLQSENADADGRKAENYGRKTVYEVIRIIDGYPLFYHDHFMRLTGSLNFLGAKPPFDERELALEILCLVRKNGVKNGNVKLLVNLAGGNTRNYFLYIQKHYYPSAEESRRGVDVGLLQWERQDPNVKVWNDVYKKSVARRMEEDRVFEVLLYDRQGAISEGSRSNVFFMRDGVVYTAPGEMVLKGITRQYVLKACMNLGYQVREIPITINDLTSVEGLFLSGTSIKVLPIASVYKGKDDRQPADVPGLASLQERIVFNSGSHPGICSIAEEFERLMKEDLNKTREKYKEEC